jgi:LmbE family N-acetylglucosaminyl deacetylase
MPSILFCFAHPDDESFAGVGLACLCRERGARVTLVTATLGEAGKAGEPPVCTREELPACRERELRAAAAIAGIDDIHLLGFQDRALADAGVGAIRQQLVSIIRQRRPEIVLTFDPNGFNLHPDHVAISRFTSDAIGFAADERSLPETGAPHQVQRLLWTPPIPAWDVPRLTNLAQQPGIDFVLDISPWREQKRAALRAHRTQHLSIDRCFFSQPDIDRILSMEAFRQAWGPPLPQRPAADIWHGIVEG